MQSYMENYSILHGQSFYPTWTLAQSYMDRHSSYPILRERASNINIYPTLHRKSFILIPSHMKGILIYMDTYNIILFPKGSQPIFVLYYMGTHPILHVYYPTNILHWHSCDSILRWHLAYPTWTSNHTLTLIPSLHGHSYYPTCTLIQAIVCPHSFPRWHSSCHK